MAHDLNAAQHEAVHTLRGPLLVLAGAGTGKTRVVTYRIAKLIQHGIKPERILAVTFTNKAAAEMQERAAGLLGKRRPTRPEISTFHSLCVRVLRRHIRLLGYPQAFAIYDRGDQEGVARAALREIRAPTAALSPGDLLSLVSRWKSTSVRPAQAAAVAETDKEHLGAMAYRRYQNALKAAGALDFDDLLLCTEELFTEHPDARLTEAGRFDHVLVDEYQDTNGSQYRIIQALASGHRNLCVVGDDDQSIYGWRGAEVTHILSFRRDWPDAKVVRLEDNYRSMTPIIEMANRLIVHNRHRHDKVLRPFRAGGEVPRVLQHEDEEVEATQIVAEIAHLIEQRLAEPREIAILVRTNEQPRAFEMELRRAQVPYVLVGGMSFYDRKEVRDILAYLKMIATPRDEVSLLRIINVPARGLGTKSVKLLMDNAVSSGLPLWETLPQAATLPGLPQAALDGITQLQRLVARFQKRLESEPLGEVVASLLGEIDYRREIQRLYPEESDQQLRHNSVEELVNAASNYARRAKKPTLSGFLEETVLAGRDEGNDKETQLARNAVALMTLHSAKGLEFPHVYLVGMEEGLLPHHRSVAADGPAIDEERRLCYVGVTRAQDRLTLSLSLSRTKWGKPRPTIPSRFLFELTGREDTPQAAKAISAAAEEFGGRRKSRTKSAGAGPAGAKPSSSRSSSTGRSGPAGRGGPTGRSGPTGRRS